MEPGVDVVGDPDGSRLGPSGGHLVRVHRATRVFIGLLQGWDLGLALLDKGHDFTELIPAPLGPGESFRAVRLVRPRAVQFGENGVEWSV